MKDFKKYQIWQSSFEMIKQIYRLLDLLPNDEKFGLKSQMSRAAVSIPSNIAEGSSRNSDKDFRRFLEIALGSSFELETQLLICVELEFLNAQQIDSILQKLNANQASINSLIQKLS